MNYEDIYDLGDDKDTTVVAAEIVRPYPVVVQRSLTFDEVELRARAAVRDGAGLEDLLAPVAPAVPQSHEGGLEVGQVVAGRVLGPTPKNAPRGIGVKIPGSLIPAFIPAAETKHFEGELVPGRTLDAEVVSFSAKEVVLKSPASIGPLRPVGGGGDQKLLMQKKEDFE